MRTTSTPASWAVSAADPFARVFLPSLKEAAACTVALRRVSDGAYVGSARHPCTGGCSGQQEQASFTNLGEAGVKYTVDVIDNYQGGWGAANNRSIIEDLNIGLVINCRQNLDAPTWERQK